MPMPFSLSSHAGDWPLGGPYCKLFFSGTLSFFFFPGPSSPVSKVIGGSTHPACPSPRQAFPKSQSQARSLPSVRYRSQDGKLSGTCYGVLAFPFDPWPIPLRPSSQFPRPHRIARTGGVRGKRKGSDLPRSPMAFFRSTPGRQFPPRRFNVRREIVAHPLPHSNNNFVSSLLLLPLYLSLSSRKYALLALTDPLQQFFLSR